jgi:hypothetical protein
MGIEGIENMTSDVVEVSAVPDKDQICTCGHSLERHIQYNSGKSLVCIERFCPCSRFRLNHIK